MCRHADLSMTSLLFMQYTVKDWRAGLGSLPGTACTGSARTERPSCGPGVESDSESSRTSTAKDQAKSALSGPTSVEDEDVGFIFYALERRGRLNHL